MERLLLAAVLVVVAVVVATVLQRRRGDPPTQPEGRGFRAPTQLDRSDFARPEAPWLVAVFTSASCSTCAKVRSQAALLDSTSVAVDDVEVGARAELHRRYAIEAVPILVIADAAGVVRHAFVGPHSATDLWATLAELREPGTTPFAAGCDAGPDAGSDAAPDR